MVCASHLHIDFMRKHPLYFDMDSLHARHAHVRHALTRSTLLCVSLSIGIVRTRSPARLSLLPHQALRADSGALIVVTTRGVNTAGSAVAGLSMRPVVAKTEAPPKSSAIVLAVHAAAGHGSEALLCQHWSLSVVMTLERRAVDICFYPNDGRKPSVRCNVTNTLSFHWWQGDFPNAIFIYFLMKSVFISGGEGMKSADRKHLKKSILVLYHSRCCVKQAFTAMSSHHRKRKNIS